MIERRRVLGLGALLRSAKERSSGVRRAGVGRLDVVGGVSPVGVAAIVLARGRSGSLHLSMAMDG